MPLSTRQQTKRKLDQATGNLDWAIDHLSTVGADYLEQHPEIAQPIAEIVQTLQTIVVLIDRVNQKI